jgi:O-antigen/teichoic acid export membrane protein
MMAAVAGALSTSLIYSIFPMESEIGMYKAAYSMIVTYAGMAFVALDNDFFPRLAAINNHRDNRNYAINQQIQVCCLLAGIMMSFMVIFMPWLIEALLSREFLPAVPMAVAGAFYVYMRSVNLPLGYLSLARGESRVFLLLEVIYDLLSVALVWGGYHQWGLPGCGIALSAAGIAESFILLVTYGIRYQFRLESKTVVYLIGMALLLGLSIITVVL